MSTQTQKAINAALTCDWDKAISINKTLLKENENDIEALNRLAYALTQTDKTNQAKKIYRKILGIDRFNLIAQKNLEKLNLFKNKKNFKKTRHQINTTLLTPNLFLEEPGKTKTVILKNVAPVSVLSNIQIGDLVHLYAKKHSIEVRNESKVYLGALPDDISFRLIRFLKSGNVYQTLVKNIQKNYVSIFIKEIIRGKRFSNQPTFIQSTHESTFSPAKMNKEEKNDDEEEINEEEL